MPIFKNFVKKAINKKDARPFKVSDGVKMVLIDTKTGKKVNYGSKDTLIEVFKINQDKKSFEIDQNLNYKLSNKNIFNFY